MAIVAIMQTNKRLDDMNTRLDRMDRKLDNIERRLATFALILHG